MNRINIHEFNSFGRVEFIFRDIQSRKSPGAWRQKVLSLPWPLTISLRLCHCAATGEAAGAAQPEASSTFLNIPACRYVTGVFKKVLDVA
jgi:hypothetical protein